MPFGKFIYPWREYGDAFPLAELASALFPEPECPRDLWDYEDCLVRTHLLSLPESARRVLKRANELYKVAV
jgi:hypothetical protein